MYISTGLRVRYLGEYTEIPPDSELPDGESVI